MSTSTSSTSNNALSSYYQNLISSILESESTKLNSLETKRTTLNSQQTDYSTLSTNLDGFEDSVKALIASNALTELKASRTSTVDPSDSDYTVATVTAKSSAAAGTYEMDVTNLAVAQQRRSTEQTSTDLSLGYTGTIWLGGNGTASTTVTPDANVTAVSTSAVADGLSELGTSDGYSLEVREINGVLKYRLKNEDNEVVSIQQQGETAGTVTSGWQVVNAGETIDTGRGLTISFGASVAEGTTDISYTAAGVSVDVESTDSLINIANAINDANQPEGRGVVATVVGKYLVFTAEETGTNHRMIYSTDVAGLGLPSDLNSTAADVRQAEDAVFTVDGLSFTRSQNSGLTDVIAGVTLDLDDDAEGQSAKIKIDYDYSSAKEAVNSFIEEFNSLISFIDEKTSTTVNQESKTYTEGSLSGDSSLSDLRSELFSVFLSSYSGTGIYTSLRDIGIEIGDGLTVSISDSEALDDALNNNFDEMTSLFEEVMSKFKETLERYTGTDGLVETTLDSVKNEIKDLNNDIDSEETRLTEREAYLTEQYGKIQAQMALLSYTSSIVSSLMGS